MNMTVGQLRKLLDKLPKDTLVGVMGHYGEFYPIDVSSVIARPNVTRVAGERRYVEPFEALVIEPPDIGPEPD